MLLTEALPEGVEAVRDVGQTGNALVRCLHEHTEDLPTGRLCAVCRAGERATDGFAKPTYMVARGRIPAEARLF